MLDIEASQVGDTGVDHGVWKLDLIIDPEAGELLAMHEYDTGDREPQITTIRDLEVIPEP